MSGVRRQAAHGANDLVAAKSRVRHRAAHGASDPVPAGRRQAVLGAMRIVAMATALLLAGCDRLPAIPGLAFGRTPGSAGSAADGVTQSTPLVVGHVVDRAGRPVLLAKVRVYDGYQLRLDGVTQSTPLDGVTQSTPLDGITRSTPLDGVTQSTPLDGITQSTPLDGVTQSTPFDGVTQSTPLETRTTTDPGGRFAVRAPERGILTIEARDPGTDVAARLNVIVRRDARLVDVGTLALAAPGAVAGRVVGPPDLDVAGTAVFVPGTDRVARADAAGAYRLEGLPAGTLRVAAVRPRFRPALAAGIAVRPGQTVQVPDLVLVPEKPELTAIRPDHAGPGATVALLGRDFGHWAGLPLAVRFGDLPAREYERLGDGEIRVTVPSGAPAGPVRVVAGGVASNGLPFTSIASVSLAPGAVRAGTDEIPRFVATAYDGAGQAVPAPLEWRVEPPDLGRIDASGTFVPARPGFGLLAVGSGAVRATASLGFGDWRAEVVLGDGTARDGPLAGPAGAVRLDRPDRVAVLATGELVFTDLGADGSEPVIRALDGAGQVRVLAGTGVPGYDGDGLGSAESRLTQVHNLLALPDGGLLFTDGLRVRAVVPGDRTLLGRALAPGKLWDLAGTGQAGPLGFGLDGPDGLPPLSTDLSEAHALAWDPRGVLLLAEHGSRDKTMRLREIAAGATRTLLASDGDKFPESPDPVTAPDRLRAVVHSLLVDPAGNVLIGGTTRIWLYCRRSGRYFGTQATAGDVVAIAGTGLARFDGDEGPALATSLWSVAAMAWLGNDLVVLDLNNGRVRLLEGSGRIRTVAGGGAPVEPNHGITAGLQYPAGMATDTDGSVYVADRVGHRILRMRRDAAAARGRVAK